MRVIGLTYPGESFLMTTQAKEIGLNPKLFYVAIGPALRLLQAALRRRAPTA